MAKPDVSEGKFRVERDRLLVVFLAACDRLWCELPKLMLGLQKGLVCRQVRLVALLDRGNR